MTREQIYYIREMAKSLKDISLRLDMMCEILAKPKEETKEPSKDTDAYAAKFDDEPFVF